MTFDVAAHGLDSHYSPAQHERIRQLILEDWAEAGVKLPTYMKLVARYIEKTGVSEDWLSKLRHQTMDNMLKKLYTPRYEFWACLHLYLNEKYGHQDIISQYAEDDIFGAAFVRYGGAQSAPNSGQYEIDNIVIDITTAEGKKFAYASVPPGESIKALDDFSLDIEHPIKGIAIKQERKTLIILRDVMTQAIIMQELEQ